MNKEQLLENYSKFYEELYSEYVRETKFAYEGLLIFIKLLFTASGGAIVTLITLITAHANDKNKSYLHILGKALDGYFDSVFLCIIAIGLFVFSKHLSSSKSHAMKSFIDDGLNAIYTEKPDSSAFNKFRKEAKLEIKVNYVLELLFSVIMYGALFLATANFYCTSEDLIKAVFNKEMLKERILNK